MFESKKEGVVISIYVQPQAPKNQIIGEHNSELKIKIKSPPVDGKANETLIAFLSDQLNLAKKNIHLISGDTSRHKKVLIQSQLSIEELKSRLGV